MHTTIAGIPAVVIFAALAWVTHHRGHRSGWTWMWGLLAVASLVGTTLLAAWLSIAVTTASGALGSIGAGIMAAIHAATSQHHGG